MPQGGIDEGEDPEAAARRELEEETGVTRARFIGRSRRWYSYDLPAELLGIAWQGRYRGQTQLWFAARFEGEESEIDLEPKPGHEREFDAWQWVPLTGVCRASSCPSSARSMKSVIEEFERARARDLDGASAAAMRRRVSGLPPAPRDAPEQQHACRQQQKIADQRRHQRQTRELAEQA